MAELTVTQEQTVTQVAQEWLTSLEQAMKDRDLDKAGKLFDVDCYWRDLVSFTWNIKTMEGKPQVLDMLEARMADVAASKMEVEGEANENDGIIEAWFTFETKVSRGKGLLRLREGKCWTLLTTMVELKGYEEPKRYQRDKGVEHTAYTSRKTWQEKRQEEKETLGYTEQPYCVIIGGGQGGIALGARLKQLNVPTIIVEKNERPGDSWRKRYKSLCLHDPVWYDHLPYIPFPDNWPVFTPKDKLGDWLEMYTNVMELNYWGSTECKKAEYDEEKKEWTVKVNRNGEEVTLHPKQLVLATGMSGKANMPDIPGAENFKGELTHSSGHPGGEQYKGKKCVVLGSNNSAHDICAALWEVGADVTMIQRSSTHIVKSDSLLELVLGDLYSEKAIENGVDHHKADLIFASLPYKLLPEVQKPAFDAIRERDAEFYKGLEDAGFMLDFGDDDSGLFLKYLRRGSGYYIDVGASQLIIDGEVKLKSNTTIDHIKEHSVVLTDGSELEADVIIFATGYNSMNGWAADLISQEVADKVGKCWGLGSDTTKDPGPWEGELRNMWKPTQQEGLWFHGGNLHQSRHYSQFLSLQLKARMEGIPTEVYGMTEVNHLK